MPRSNAGDRDWIRACVARTPGAWAQFVCRTLPIAVHLVERIFNRHGAISSQLDRDKVVENIYSGFVVEDMKILRSFRPEYDLIQWLAVRCRMECRRHISDSRRQSPLGLMRSVKEPDPDKLVEVLHEIPSSVRTNLAAHFEGPPARVPGPFREILAECRGKLIDLMVSGKEMTACLPFERLSGFADGVTTEKITLHLNGCAHCAQELERIAAVDRLLRDLIFRRPRGLKMRGLEDLGERVRRILPAPPKPRSRRRVGGKR